MGARIAQGSAGRMRYYHMLDRDADGYVSKEDFIQGSRWGVAHASRPAARACPARLAAG